MCTRGITFTSARFICFFSCFTSCCFSLFHSLFFYSFFSYFSKLKMIFLILVYSTCFVLLIPNNKFPLIHSLLCSCGSCNFESFFLSPLCPSQWSRKCSYLSVIAIYKGHLVSFSWNLSCRGKLLVNFRPYQLSLQFIYCYGLFRWAWWIWTFSSHFMKIMSSFKHVFCVRSVWGGWHKVILWSFFMWMTFYIACFVGVVRCVVKELLLHFSQLSCFDLISVICGHMFIMRNIDDKFMILSPKDSLE